MSLYADAINNPGSKKIAFVKASFLKHFYAWTLQESGIWKQSSAELVESLTENDVTATETTTYALLQSQSVVSVGAWFYDEAADLLYYKAKSGTTAFENFVVGTIVFRFSQFPAEDDHSRPHDAKLVAVPSVKLAVSQIFESKASRVGSGSMGVETTDYLFSRLDFEPDGQVEVYEAIEETS